MIKSETIGCKNEDDFTWICWYICHALVVFFCHFHLVVLSSCCTQVYKREMYRVHWRKKTFMTATENKWSNIWKMGHFQAHQFKELFMLRVRVRVICVYCIQTCKYIDIDMLSVQHETRLILMETYLKCIHWVFIRIRFRLRQQKNTRTRTRTKNKSTKTTPAPVSFGRLQDKLYSFWKTFIMMFHEAI